MKTVFIVLVRTPHGDIIEGVFDNKPDAEKHLLTMTTKYIVKIVEHKVAE